MRKFRLIICLVLAALLTLSLVGCGGGSSSSSSAGSSSSSSNESAPAQEASAGAEEQQEVQKVTLSIATGHAANGIGYAATMKEFFEPEVTARAKEAGIEVTWNEAYAGALCSLTETLEAVETGLCDIGGYCPIFESAKIYGNVFSFFVPYGSADYYAVANATMKTYEEVPELRNVLEEDYNQKFLGAGVSGNYDMCSTFPVNTMSDLVGKRICGAGINLEWFEGSGVVTVQGNLSDAYTSLQTGVYEAWAIFAASSGTGYKLYEVAPYYTKLDQGVVNNSIITINMETWNSLPAALQDILVEVGSEFAAKSAEISQRMDEEGLAMFEENGYVSTLDPAERQALIDNLPNMPQTKADELNAEGWDGTLIMQTYLKALAEEAGGLDRDWDVQ